MAVLTPVDLNKVIKATYRRVDSRNPKKPDRKRRPMLRWLESMKKDTTFEGGEIVYPVKKSFTDQGQTWAGDDTLAATDPDFQLNMAYGYCNFNTAITVKHDELTRMGYSVEPNGRGSFQVRVKSQDDVYKIIRYVEELVEGHDDNHDRRLDQLIHLPATLVTDTNGVFGILTDVNNAGLVGGVDRATESVVRHYVDLTMAVPALSSDFRTKMDLGLRSTRQYMHDNGLPGDIDMFFCGAGFMERAKKWGELNNYRIDRNVNDELKHFDFGIPDKVLSYEGIPLVWDPTMDYMDTAIPAAAPDYTLRAIGVSKANWKYRTLMGRYKTLSAPPDPANQRISRMDIDSTYHIACDAPAGNMMVSFAA
jgi:hypothetical protein